MAQESLSVKKTEAPVSGKPKSSASGMASPAIALLELARRARAATTQDELVFHLVNGTHTLVPYRQAVLWTTEGRPRGLSGVSQADINAPYVQWLSRLQDESLKTCVEAGVVDVSALSPDMQEAWHEWLPAYGLYTPFAGSTPGGLLCARERTWTDQEIAIMREWLDIWLHAWQALVEKNKPRSKLSWQAFRSAWASRSWRNWLGIGTQLPWYKRKIWWIFAGVVVFFLFPVRLTVLAPGELVPTDPIIVRSPIEGVIDTIHVQPNELVTRGQPLFDFDQALLRSRAEVAEQSLETALAQYRQTTQMALTDKKYKSELAAQAGLIKERRAEAVYLADQLNRSTVVAQEEGVVLFDDATAWRGTPVTIGETVMRVVRPGEVEVEAWLPLADAVTLEEGSRVQLYLQSEPLDPVKASLRYVAHKAVERPDGVYAYRVRATLAEPTTYRVGLKGTAKLESHRTTMFYWLFRRPLSVVRTTLGI